MQIPILAQAKASDCNGAGTAAHFSNLLQLDEIFCPQTSVPFCRVKSQQTGESCLRLKLLGLVPANLIWHLQKMLMDSAELVKAISDFLARTTSQKRIHPVARSFKESTLTVMYICTFWLHETFRGLSEYVPVIKRMRTLRKNWRTTCHNVSGSQSSHCCLFSTTPPSSRSGFPDDMVADDQLWAHHLSSGMGFTGANGARIDPRALETGGVVQCASVSIRASYRVKSNSVRCLYIFDLPLVEDGWMRERDRGAKWME